MIKTVISALAILLLVSVALADSEAFPRAYTVTSSDGNYIFVMLSSGASNYLLDPSSIALRIKYKK